MSVLATDKRQLTLIYSSQSHLGKQILGYVQGVGDKLRPVDITKTKIADTVWVTLADGLGKSLGELFSKDHLETEIDEEDSFDTDDWLKLIQNNPNLLQRPIAVKGEEFMQVENRSEILKFFEVDSAGLEKKPLGESPTTSSTTDDERFV